MKNTIAIAILIVITLLHILFIEALERSREITELITEVGFSRSCNTPLRAELLFAGDWMQHTPQITSAKRDSVFDYTPSIRHIAPIMRRADLAIVNLETTLTRGKHYSGYPMFRSPKQLADALHEAGIDVALLANNHCCDGGKRGIRSTIKELKRCSIEHTGAFADSADYSRNYALKFERQGIKFAILNYTYGTNGLPIPDSTYVNLIDSALIARHIQSLERDSIDCLIACMHWGVEYSRRPSLEQRRIAGQLQEMGVDLIVGSHPHVVQPIGAEDGFAVAYSLGNFVSNQRKRYCDGGIILSVKIEKQSIDSPCSFDIEAIPVWVELKDYAILPANVGDTIKMSPSSRKQYELFMSDCKELIGEWIAPIDTLYCAIEKIDKN